MSNNDKSLMFTSSKADKEIAYSQVNVEKIVHVTRFLKSRKCPQE